MSERPLGPEVDPWPRPLPARTAMAGAHVALEPLHRRHVAELFEAARTAGEDFTYLDSGPFDTRDAMMAWVTASAARHDPMFWAVRPVASGAASGWLALSDIAPEHASIEIGHIWFSPRMQRTRAATEAVSLLLWRAADELGYRRLGWRCDALNQAAMRAAERLGFTAEGVLRGDKVVKGRLRNTAVFSITAEEWPSRRDAMAAWLAPDNFAHDGTARRGLASFRDEQQD